MAIKVKHTDVETIAKLGLLAGKSVAAQKEIERTQAAARLAQQMEHEKKMTAFRAQLDLQAAMRSQQWELEKMEIRSRLDFERSERERMRKLDDIDNALRQIDREVETGRITESQADVLRFNQEMKRYGTAPPVSLIKPPTPERPRRITPSEQMRAYELLQKEELREPTWWERMIPGGKGELTEEELFYREMFEKTARGIPTGTITTPAVQAPAEAYKIGQIIERGGAKYKVVGFDTDGMPLVELI
jgi:hypothetical protein